MKLICILHMNKTIVFLKNWMVVLTLWCIIRFICIIYSYFEKGCRKKCARDNPERQYGIWSIHCSWHCSCRTYFCCFPLALANVCPWSLVPFFQVSSKNSELKTTHNPFRDCRVHFFRQPFSKWLHMNKTNAFLKRWWSWHYDVRLDIKKACNADLFSTKTNHVICSS